MSRNSTYTSAASSTSFAPEFIPVTTTTGFNQGDLIFQNNGDFQQLTRQVSSASFPNNISNPILSGALGGIGGSLGYPMSSSSTTTSGGSSLRNVALLTNGNFVTVSANGSGHAYFTIYDSSFNIVVSRTTLPTTFISSYVGVASLTGGGFVIYFTENVNNYFAYAIYSNTGTVVSALAAVNSLGASYTTSNASTYWNVVALSNGGFVAATVNASVSVPYLIFNSSGTRTYNAIFGMAAATTTDYPMLAAGSSGSFAVIYKASGSSANQWYLISSTNTTLNSGTITQSNSLQVPYSAATLSDGINVVFFYGVDNSGNYAYRFLNTSTYVLGSATSISILSNTSSSNIASIAVRSLSTGGFITFWQTSPTSISGSISVTGLYYSVFNSSGTPMGSSTQTATAPVFRHLSQISPVQGYINLSLSTIELGGNLYVFFQPFAGSNASGVTSYTNYIPISLTNYSPITSLGYTGGTFGAVTSATGTVALSGSTPTKAAYFPLSNSVTQLTATSATATTPTRVAAHTSTNFDVCTLTNGNFVIAYRNDSTYAISASVYSPTGTLLTTFSVGTGFASTQFYSVRITPLASGKFVIAYTTGSSAITVNIYSSTYAVTNTFNLTGLTLSITASTSYQGFALGSLSSDRFIIAATSASNSTITYWVYNNSGTQLATGTIGSAGFYVTAIQGHQSGGFSVFHQISSSAGRLDYFGESSTNTFTSVSQQSITSPAGTNPTGTGGAVGKLFINQFNEAFFNYPVSGTTQTAFAFVSSLSGVGSWYATGGATSSSTANIMLCVPTASGYRAFIDMGSSNTVVGINNTSTKIVSTTLSSITVAANTQTAVASPLYGNVVVVVYPNSANSNFLHFSLITIPYNSVNVLNTTSSVSDAVSLPIQTYPFVGVAANTAPAGGVGILQTKGVAQLNSNYSESTPAQSFDSQMPSGVGVRGTIVGRTITLLGNT